MWDETEDKIGRKIYFLLHAFVFYTNYYFIKELNRLNFLQPIIFVSPDKEYSRDKKLLGEYNLFSDIELLEKKKLVKIFKFKDINNPKTFKILNRYKCNIGISTSCRNIFKKE